MAEYTSCDDCRHSDKGLRDFPCTVCIHNAIDKFEPMTQNDRINNMTPEEKAEWLFEHDRITEEKGRLSKKQLLEWLKSEVKE